MKRMKRMKDIVEIGPLRDIEGRYGIRVKFASGRIYPEEEGHCVTLGGVEWLFVNAFGDLIYKTIPTCTQEQLTPYLLDPHFLIRQAAEKRYKVLIEGNDKYEYSRQSFKDFRRK